MEYTITNVGLLVQNVQEVADFYQAAFSLTRKQDFPTFIEFNSKGATLFLWQWSHLEEHLGKEAMARVKHPFMAAIFMDSVEQVDQAYRELNEKGAEFLTPPTDWPWKAHAAYFVDPEGYIWEIYAWL